MTPLSSQYPMVQYITHANAQWDYADGARQALQGGCRWIQLRMKHATHDEARRVALELMPLCREHDATFVIDDRVALALELGADGVHLGQDDMPLTQARALLGPHAIIGATANTPAQALAAISQGATYIGYGPYRHTTTKERLAPTLGLEGYQSLVQALAAHHATTPVVAIGGITLADVPAIMATGVQGIAVSGAVLTATSPANAMAQLIEATGMCEKGVSGS